MKKILLPLLMGGLLLSPLSAKADHFSDLAGDHWAYHSIHSLSENGVVTGYPNGTFKPQQEVTRAQSAVILARALKLDLNTSFKPKFKDVAPTHRSYKEIAALTEKGVFNNVERFNPGDSLTRAQMAKIINESFGIIVDSNHQLAFGDVQSTHWAHDYIVTIAEAGISYGTTADTFQPQRAINRAQLAAFTDRALAFTSRVKAKEITYNTVAKMYSVEKTVAHDTISLLNQERAKVKLMPLEEDPELSKIARIKAEDMANNGYFEHTSPTYGKPWEMALRFGYPTDQIGENIAYGYMTANAVMAGWMNSPGHKANILRNGYNALGVGYAKNKAGVPYWVHMFAIK